MELKAQWRIKETEDYVRETTQWDGFKGISLIALSVLLTNNARIRKRGCSGSSQRQNRNTLIQSAELWTVAD